MYFFVHRPYADEASQLPIIRPLYEMQDAANSSRFLATKSRVKPFATCSSGRSEIRTGVTVLHRRIQLEEGKPIKLTKRQK
jgi:hypothetical protein